MGFKQYLIEVSSSRKNDVSSEAHEQLDHAAKKIIGNEYSSSKENIDKMKIHLLHHIREYKRGAAFTINERLRMGEPVEDGEYTHYKQTHDHIQHLTNQSTKHHFVVYRGLNMANAIDPEKTGGKNLSELKKGDTFHDKGFVSTSFDPKVSSSFAEHKDKLHLAKIHIKPGDKGNYLDAHKHGSSFDSEKEFLIHKGTHFRVKGHSKGSLGGIPVHFTHLEIHKQED